MWLCKRIICRGNAGASFLDRTRIVMVAPNPCGSLERRTSDGAAGVLMTNPLCHNVS